MLKVEEISLKDDHDEVKIEPEYKKLGTIHKWQKISEYLQM